MTDNTPEATPPATRKSLWSRMRRGFRRGAIRLENSASFMYLRAISRAGIILIAVGFFLDLDDRQAATKFRAWQTLTSTAPGNVGKADAMTYLVAMGEPLNRIDATGAYLAGADLTGASLDQANLSDTDLTNAILSGATLIETVLVNAVLVGARLDGAFLDEANLQGARLIRADLTGASVFGANLFSAALDAAELSNADLGYGNLSDVSFGGARMIGTSLAGANISGATFERATGLSSDQLAAACIFNGMRPVSLPAGDGFEELEFKDCATDRLRQDFMNNASAP